MKTLSILILLMVSVAQGENPWLDEIKVHLQEIERGFKIEKVSGLESVEGAIYCPKLHRLADGYNHYIPVLDPKDIRCITSQDGTATGPLNWLELHGYDGVRVHYKDRVKNTRAIQVVYTTEEGFDQRLRHDEIFIVELLPENEYDNRVSITTVPPRYFKIGKPDQIEELKRKEDEINKFLDPDNVDVTTDRPPAIQGAIQRLQREDHKDRENDFDVHIRPKQRNGTQIRYSVDGRIVTIHNTPLGEVDVKWDTIPSLSSDPQISSSEEMGTRVEDNPNSPWIEIKWSNGKVDSVTWDGRPIKQRQAEQEAADDSDAVRTFTDKSGKFSVEARFLGVANNRVILQKKSDGKEIVVPVDKLSQSDQAWISAQAP